MAAWQTGDVQANGIRVHYTRSGGTKPPLVLAHGVTDDGPCWTPLAEVLAPDYDVIMVDARGHGRSEAPAGGYEAATLAADLAGVITALGLHRPIVLGHSMGAITALAMAGTYPDVPGAILLEDPPPWWMGPLPASAPNPAEQIRVWFASLHGQSREELIAAQVAETPWWTQAELAPWADAKLRVSPNADALFDRSVPTSVDWPAVLPCIACPVLLITADPERGAIVYPASAARLQQLVPQTRVVHIPGAGHNIHRDQPSAYLDPVRPFLTALSR